MISTSCEVNIINKGSCLSNLFSPAFVPFKIQCVTSKLEMKNTNNAVNIITLTDKYLYYQRTWVSLHNRDCLSHLNITSCYWWLQFRNTHSSTLSVIRLPLHLPIFHMASIFMVSIIVVSFNDTLIQVNSQLSDKKILKEIEISKKM